ncbi:techylectin-5A-like [Tachypleus tridentatus]|uniref:techylectin-5A-like n=1 Tax=Tachypleus tridentatus TaxID=6853 RepID=UPI003FCFE650
MECLEASSGPRDCTDVFLNGNHTSGVYRIWPKSWMFTGSFDVYCDMDTDGGGWTYLNTVYTSSFGNYWIFTLTNQGTYSIRFDLTDKEGEKRFALYREFRIDNEELYYRLHVKGFTGDAGKGSTGENSQVPSGKADVKVNMNTNTNDPIQGLAIKLPGLGPIDPIPKFFAVGGNGSALRKTHFHRTGAESFTCPVPET